MHDGCLASRVDDVLCQEGPRSVVSYLDRNGKLASSFTATTLRERVVERACVIKNLIPSGGLAFVILPPGPDFLVSLLGCIYAGVIAVPLPVPQPGPHADRFGAALLDACPRVIFCNASSIEPVNFHLDKLKPLAVNPRVFVVEEFDRRPRECGAAYLLPGLSKEAEEPVIVQYSSGSTRSPRGIALSSRNLLSNAALLAEHWHLGRESIVASWLPHHHDLGLMGGLLFPLLYRAKSVQMSPLTFVQRPFRWLRAISEWRATASGGPAFAFQLCLDTIDHDSVRNLDLSSWQVAFCGAEPIPPGLLQRFRERFSAAGLDPGAVHACYGLAEATLFVAGERDWSGNTEVSCKENTSEPCRLSGGTRGNIRIVDPASGELLADSETGEIWVSGGSVSRGYLKGSEIANEETDFSGALEGETKNYLRTGDLGRIEPEGLFVSGRLKDVLIADGVNVAASDIEHLAAAHHPSLNSLASAAVSISHSGDCQLAALLLEVKTARACVENPEEVAERIRRAVRASHGVDLQIIRFIKRGSLERTTSGKIRRQAVATRLREGHSYPEAVR